MRIGVSLDDRVGEVADTVAHAARVFEIVGIDFCDKRDRTLKDAAKTASFDTDELLQLIDPSAPQPSSATINDPATASLNQLTRYVVNVHHKRARWMLVRMTLLAGSAASSHPDKKLWPLVDLIAKITRDLVPHMRREEQYLFPYIESFERPMGPDETIVVPLFGSVEYPMQRIRHDHSEDLASLTAIREATASFTPPKGACDHVCQLYKMLQEFDTDLQQHIRLENDILFPRAIDAERAAAKRK
jgi:regulator of cell morphogenesis and NO signaling